MWERKGLLITAYGYQCDLYDEVHGLLITIRGETERHVKELTEKLLTTLIEQQTCFIILAPHIRKICRTGMVALAYLTCS